MDAYEAMLALTRVRGLGPVLLQRLMARFAYDPVRIWQATREELAEVDGMREGLWQAMQKVNWHAAGEEYKKARDKKLQLWYYHGPGYPANLLPIHDPPPLLYGNGSLLPQDQYALAIVGTRQPTNYGKSQAYHLAFELAKKQITIVSGLARGIDAAAHQGALDGNGRTLAVLGHGLGTIYPPEHYQLARHILAHGALLSEFSIDEGPNAYHFPQRNRIISGLAFGVIVIEGKQDSGALITADMALEQGREVFALPGPIDHLQSEGPNSLIQQGAKLITKVDDILEEIEAFTELLPLKGKGEDGGRKLNEPERRIWQVLSADPVDIEVITIKSGLVPALVSSTLLQMELKGFIQACPGQCYVRKG